MEITGKMYTKSLFSDTVDMVDMETLKALIGISAVRGWDFIQTDASEAFLTTRVNKVFAKRHDGELDEPDGT